MAITLYGISASPFVRKTLIVAEHLKLDFDNVPVAPFDKPENYEQISPLGKIPALTDGDLTLADSSVICDYLNNQYGNNEFYPTDPALKAKALWFETYADTKLAEVLAGVFVERVLNPKFKNIPTDTAKVDDIINNQQPPVFDYLEAQLPDSGFILGDMNIADIAIGSQFVNGHYGQVEVDGEKWPKVAAYVAMLLALPAFVKRMTEDAKIFA